jgi:hypothetical protein
MNNISVGCALSDVNRADLPNGWRVPERLTDYVRRFQKLVGTEDFSFELQPEDHWTLPAIFPDQFVERKTNRWWRAFRQNGQLLMQLQNASAPIGVHQPVQGRDILSSNFFSKYEAIAETKQAMAFCQFIGADYFVFHLSMTDHWGWERRDQIEKALKLFKFFSAFYHASSFSFVPCIQLLEFPRFPAVGGEASALLRRCRDIWPETQFAFDISHLWGSRRRMMAANLWDTSGAKRVSFVDALDYGLEQTWQDTFVYHLGGCWESETHAVPGLHPQQDPFHFPIKLRESPSVYAENGELDLNRTLDLLLDYTVRRGRPLRLMLQIFDRDIDQVLEATRQIRTELLSRAENQAAPPAPAPPVPAEKKTRARSSKTTRASKRPARQTKSTKRQSVRTKS